MNSLLPPQEQTKLFKICKDIGRTGIQSLTLVLLVAVALKRLRKRKLLTLLRMLTILTRQLLIPRRKSLRLSSLILKQQKKFTKQRKTVLKTIRILLSNTRNFLSKNLTKLKMLKMQWLTSLTLQKRSSNNSMRMRRPDLIQSKIISEKSKMLLTE